MLNKTNQIIEEAFKHGYYVNTSTGEVFNKKHKSLKHSIGPLGYALVSVYIPNITRDKGTMQFVHRLVAYAKYGEKLFTKGLEVRHLNGIKTDNRGENICLGTRADNIADIPPEILSAQRSGKPSPHQSLNSKAIKEVRFVYNRGLIRGECIGLARKYNVTSSVISALGRGKTYVNN